MKMEICIKDVGCKVRPVIVFLTVILCSCTTEKPQEIATEVKTYDVSKTATASDEKASGRNEGKTAIDNPGEAQGMEVSLKFTDLTITSHFEELWSEEDYLSQIHTDTIVIQLGLSDKMSGHAYVIQTDSAIQSVEIFQNYETSLTLMNEGPHIDLTEWKHYVSDWKKLDLSHNGFKTFVYSQEDQTKFPDVTPDEIVQAVSERLADDSDGWIKLAGECKGANDYPCGISISRINLKVVTTDVHGVKKERFVIFEIPMGC